MKKRWLQCWQGRWYLIPLTCLLLSMLACGPYSALSTPVSTSTEPAIPPDNIASLYVEAADVQYVAVGQEPESLAQQQYRDMRDGDGVYVLTEGYGIVSFPDLWQLRIYRDSNVTLSGSGVLTTSSVNPDASPVAAVVLALGYIAVNDDAGKHIAISTPNGVTITVRGTQLYVHYDPEQEATWVVVTEGVVEVTSAGSTVEVPAHFQTWATAGVAPIPPLPATRPIVGDRFPTVEELTANREVDSAVLDNPQCTVRQTTNLRAEPGSATGDVLPGGSRFEALGSRPNWIFGFVPNEMQYGWVRTPLVDCAYSVEDLADGQEVIEALNLSTPIVTVTPISTPTPTATATAEPTVTKTAAPPTSTPTRTCPHAKNDGINLREGPGTDYEIVGQLRATTCLEIVARNDASNWYKLDNGYWVSAPLIVNGPQMEDLKVDEPTPTATFVVPLPTDTVTDTPVPLPTETDTVEPPDKVTPTPTLAPTDTPTPLADTGSTSFGDLTYDASEVYYYECGGTKLVNFSIVASDPDGIMSLSFTYYFERDGKRLSKEQTLFLKPTREANVFAATLDVGKEGYAALSPESGQIVYRIDATDSLSYVTTMKDGKAITVRYGPC